MKRRFLATFFTCAITSTGWALDYNQSTGWTTGTGGGLKLGLRAIDRDNGSFLNNQGFYFFLPGVAGSDDSKALWNFEFSIDATSPGLGAYDFYLGIDTDSSIGVNYQSYLVDPLTYLFPQGNTINNQDSHEIAHNSLNIATFLPFQYSNQEGDYDFRLFAVAKEVGNSPDPSLGGIAWPETSLPLNPAADVNIRVTVANGTSVPDAGSTFAMIGFALTGLIGISRRKLA